jgi:putative ABC transport system permease protein
MRQKFSDVHAAFFEADRSLGYLLVFLIISLMAVCWLGVGALTSFWIRQRYRSIGIRRALGATRRTIWWQFSSENALVVTMGLVIGLPAAVAMSGWLVRTYAIPPLNLVCLPVVAMAFYASCLGAIAFTLARATAVSPMIAVRS